jgi:Tfp pilus assembly protein PilF
MAFYYPECVFFTSAILAEPAHCFGITLAVYCTVSICILRSTMATTEELFEQGGNLFADGNMEEAVAAFEQAIAQDPSYADAYHGLAMCYAEKGDLDKAIKTVKQLAAIHPDDVLAHTSLSMFYQKKGMILEAEKEGAAARILTWKEQLRTEAIEKKG